jgi:hypothetical protein
MRETLETKLLKRIDRKRGDVFLRPDFGDLGEYDQVGRVLRKLVRRGKLMKVGFGLYSRAIRSPFDDKTLVPPKGLATLREALKRVGIETLQSRSIQDYNAGRTAQVPTGRVVGVRQRVRRKIGYNGINLSFETC